jgi:hypothetical protein
VGKGDNAMMTMKRLLLIAVLPFTIAVTVGALAMLPPRPGVTKANFDHINAGMTESEVEAIFGRKAERRDVCYGNSAGMGAGVLALWAGEDKSGAFVWFANDGVDDKNWINSKETVVEKIRRRLHLR